MALIKTKEEIEAIEEGGKILAGIMDCLKKEVIVGVSGDHLNNLAEELILKNKGFPSFKNYNGFPAALCLSLNEEIVHGIPFGKKIKEGDVVSLDLGFFYKGFHNDMATTVFLNEVPFDVLRLIKTTKKALKRGIKKARIGNTLGDIGNTIERCITSQGFKVIENLCGHGIGKEVHEPPDVLNFGKRHKGMKIEEGMILCLEPMASLGSSEIVLGKDMSTYKTKDSSISAHFEHTIIITKDGAKVATEL